MKWIVLILLVGLLSCQRSEVIPNTCDVKNPLQDLPWLKTLIKDDGLGSAIYQGTYQNQTVFAVYGCGRCFAGPFVTIYRCDQSVICSGLLLDNSANSCGQIAKSLTDQRTLLEYKAL